MDFEKDFLRMIEEGKRQRAALFEALDIVRSFQRGDPDAFATAGRRMRDLEDVELQAREIEAKGG